MTAPPPASAPDAHGLCVIPRGVWMLGFVSLFMDTSSEFVHSLLPVFLTGTLGASVGEVGLLEGAAEATAFVTKVFSGVISDWFGRRKPLDRDTHGPRASRSAIRTLTGS